MPGPAGPASPEISTEAAREGLDRLQGAMGVMFLASACAGGYLLATDRSLWLLALSHAVGLAMLIAIDVVLGAFSLRSKRSAYVPSIAAAVLGLVLQLGDVATAPQYSQTVAHFAEYLFGLWAFDAILALQVGVLMAGLYGRSYASHLARRKSRRGRELSYTRRGFLKSIVGFAGLVGLGAAVSSIKLPVPSQQATSTTTTATGTPQGAVANVNRMQVGTPVQFEYPAGYPNLLLKRPDGSVSAVSLLCTHVCCQCVYVPSRSLVECPCHGSVFDSSGNVLQGPAVAPLPTIELRVDSEGYVFPTGVSNPGPCQV